MADFSESVRDCYRKDFWASLPHHVEVFVEKDAVAGTVQPVTSENDVAIRVCRGYASVSFNREESMGELHMIAVDPDAQQRGIGGRLTVEAVERIRAAGMSIAMIETGSDPGHAPARATYARAGFRHVPISRFFLAL